MQDKGFVPPLYVKEEKGTVYKVKETQWKLPEGWRFHCQYTPAVARGLMATEAHKRHTAITAVIAERAKKIHTLEHSKIYTRNFCLVG